LHPWSEIEGFCEQEGTDMREMLIYGSYGSMVSNVGHLWYRHLHVITNRSLRLSTYPMIGVKLAADMFIFNPVHVTALLTWKHILMQKPLKVRLQCKAFKRGAGCVVCSTR
jgi:hypothetical protein